MTGAASPLRILLVEDDAADAHLVRLAMTETHINATLEHVVDGREALEYLRRETDGFKEALRPDLILLDLNMPRLDGREFLVAVKADAVVMSTSDVERDVRGAYRLGAAGYVAKPLDVSEFIAEIRQLGEYWTSLVRLPERR